VESRDRISRSRDKQVKIAIVVVIAPGRTCRPSAQRDSGLFREIGERAVLIVVVEAVLAEIGNVDVGPAVVIVVADHRAKTQRWLATPAWSVTSVKVPS